MKTKYLFTIALLFVATTFFAFRFAEDPFATLLKKLAAYHEANPHEKVYLHLDKPYYAIGDNIWFKAYVRESRNNQLSAISSALYVELINENDSIKKQIKLPLVNGLSWGDFKLPDTLSEGNYRIRAYTQWMRNAGPDYFFDKTIRVGNAWSNKVFTSTSYVFGKKNNTETVEATIKFTDIEGKPYPAKNVNYEAILGDKGAGRGKGLTNARGEVTFTFQNATGRAASGYIMAKLAVGAREEVIKRIPVKATSSSIDVRLFPEGGNFVDALPSKVGIKAVNAAGLGEAVTGSIIDGTGAVLTTFSTGKLGMGNFVIIPEVVKTYTAEVKMNDGSTIKVPLPQVQPKGYVLSVNNKDTSKVSVKVMLSESLLNQGDLKLLIQQGEMVTQQTIKTNKQVSMLSIPKKDLFSGILRLTLFNSSANPVAERLVFINNPADHIQTELTGLNARYEKRGKVEAELSAITDGKAAEGSFSIAVTNASIVIPDPDNESNILSNLLLTSDLKGFIEKPNYYFRDESATTRNDLDDLMLTQGWSRFLWSDLTAATLKKITFPAEKTLKVSGTITTTGGKPVEKGRVSLFATGGGLFMVDTLTDDKGRFNFDNLIFGDSTKFVVQARTAKNKKFVEINLDVVPGQVVTKNKNTGDITINVNESIKSYIEKSNAYFDDLSRRGLLERTILLDQVNVVEKKTAKSWSSNLNGALRADAVINSKDLVNYTNLAQALQGRVAGMNVSTVTGEAFLLRNNGRPMQIILDGTYVDSGFLNTINPFDVETVEVLKSISNTAIYGSQGSGGLIIITTKRGGTDMGYSRYAPGIVTFAPKGYYAIREFYSPKYIPGNEEGATDRRSTVYWNPHVATDAKGTGKFEFYNTDEPGSYRIVIEGIDGNGHLARRVYTYEVQ